MDKKAIQKQSNCDKKICWLITVHINQSKKKVLIGDNDSTWLPVVVKKKVAPIKIFETFHCTNISVEVPPKTKKGKLLNPLLRNKEKKSNTNTSTIGARARAYDESNKDKVVEAVSIGEQSKGLKYQ